MEVGTVSVLDSVPIFARGFKILLVHDDTLHLTHLSSMLEQYSFKVTTADLASVAVSKICDQKGQFKLVMAKANLRDMDILSFLYILLEKDIPVILISSGEYNSATWKTLAARSCFFLEEPISLQDLKYAWQHVYHTTKNLANVTQNANSDDQVHGANDRTRYNHVTKKKEKTVKHSLVQTNTGCHRDTVKEGEDERIQHNQRKRAVWTPELHLKFTAALSVLDDKNIRPKAILQTMNVPELTVRQVASHLQKYKNQVRRIQQNCISNLPPVSKTSNSRRRTNFPAPFESQNHLPESACAGSSLRIQGNASTVSLNENQNQNQFAMNFSERQGPGIRQLQEIPDNANFSYELPAEFVNCGSQNLDAVVENVLDVSMDPNHPQAENGNISRFFDNSQAPGILQQQEILGNATFSNTLPAEFFNCRSKNLDAVLENSVSNASTDPIHIQAENDNILELLDENQGPGILQLQEILGNATVSCELPAEFVNCGSQNSDATVQHTVSDASMDPIHLQAENDNILELLDEYQALGILQMQEISGNVTVSCELQAEFVNCGSQNLDAVVEHTVSDAATDPIHLQAKNDNISELLDENRGPGNLQLQETPSNVTVSCELPAEFMNWGSQNLDAAVEHTVSDASLDPIHLQAKNDNILEELLDETNGPEIFELREIPGNANFSYELPGEFNCGSQNLDAVVEHTMSDASIGPIHLQAENDNTLELLDETHVPGILQLQEIPGNATFLNELPAEFVNCGSQNLDAIVDHTMPDASIDPTHPQVENDNILKLLDEIQGPENLPNQAILDNVTFQYELPSEFADCGSQNLDAVVEHIVPDASMNPYHPQAEKDNIFKFFDESQGPGNLQVQEILGSATFRNELPMEFVNYGSPNLNALLEHPVPDSSMDSNRPLAECDNILKLLDEDCDEYDPFGKEINSDDVDHYHALLREVIHGNN